MKSEFKSPGLPFASSLTLIHFFKLLLRPGYIFYKTFGRISASQCRLENKMGNVLIPGQEQVIYSHTEREAENCELYKC